MLNKEKMKILESIPGWKEFCEQEETEKANPNETNCHLCGKCRSHGVVGSRKCRLNGDNMARPRYDAEYNEVDRNGNPIANSNDLEIEPWCEPEQEL